MRLLPLGAILAAALAAAACGRGRPPSNLNDFSQPWTKNPPAPGGGVSAVQVPGAIDPRVSEETPARVVPVRLEVRRARVQIAPGKVYEAWTFNGRVPGPTLRVRRGDTLAITLVNHGLLPHRVGFHAAELAPGRTFHEVAPGDSAVFRWSPMVPGIFLYHGGTTSASTDVANGLYGALLVDPPHPVGEAYQFVLVQGEWYTRPDKDSAGVLQLDTAKLMAGTPDVVAFNGIARQYAEHPILVPAGARLRFFVVNAGPNRMSAFHVSGALFARVFPDTIPTHAWEGLGTVTLPPGEGMIFEVRLAEPGRYPFFTHVYSDAARGAMGLLEAE
jgi:nitrite reductase (NO-forming)